MISREILDTQRSQYVKGRDEAAAGISAFNGAIECIDGLLSLLTEMETVQAVPDEEKIAGTRLETLEVDNNG